MNQHGQPLVTGAIESPSVFLPRVEFGHSSASPFSFVYSTAHNPHFARYPTQRTWTSPSTMKHRLSKTFDDSQSNEWPPDAADSSCLWSRAPHKAYEANLCCPLGTVARCTPQIGTGIVPCCHLGRDAESIYNLFRAYVGRILGYLRTVWPRCRPFCGRSWQTITMDMKLSWTWWCSLFFQRCWAPFFASTVCYIWCLWFYLLHAFQTNWFYFRFILGQNYWINPKDFCKTEYCIHFWCKSKPLSCYRPWIWESWIKNSRQPHICVRVSTKGRIWAYQLQRLSIFSF